MNNLIKITTNEQGEQLVSARELHKFLEVKSNFTTWFERMTEYGFTEGVDFIPILEKSTGGRPQQDFAIKLDMAKEISMIQRSEKGKQARQYFIQVERFWNSPEMVTKRALEYQQAKILQLETENQSLKPKALFATAFETSDTLILVRELATIIKQKGFNIGEKRLFQWLRENGYLIKRKGSDKNMPTQKSLELGLFFVIEGTVQRSDGNVYITKTPKVTGKGQTYFVNKFLGETA